MMINQLSQLLPLFMLAILILCIGLIIRELLKSSATKPSQSAAQSAKTRRASSRRQKPAAAAVKLKQAELLSLVNGDTAAAQRLLDRAKQNNPGREPVWYVEKVIEDLIRDRR